MALSPVTKQSFKSERNNIMTTEEKAKAYDKILKVAEDMLNHTDENYICKDFDKENFRTLLGQLLPELAESEDERIRKEIIRAIEDLVDTIPAPDCRTESEERELKTYNRWIDYLEKQKEPIDGGGGDFIIYHPLKNSKGEYECIPYSFYGSLSSFSDDKDLMDFLRTCFYTEQECEEWIKSQKPVEWSEQCKKRIDEIAKYMKSKGYEDDAEFLESLYPQANIEWSEEDTISLTNAILSAEKEWGKDSFTAKWLKELPSRLILQSNKQEWSEEDERMIESIIGHLERQKNYQTNIINIEQCQDWIKSLKNKYPSQPRWKPTEEQMSCLLEASERNQTKVGSVLLSIYNDLKKL